MGINVFHLIGSLFFLSTFGYLTGTLECTIDGLIMSISILTLLATITKPLAFYWGIIWGRSIFHYNRIPWNEKTQIVVTFFIPLALLPITHFIYLYFIHLYLPGYKILSPKTFFIFSVLTSMVSFTSGTDYKEIGKKLLELIIQPAKKSQSIVKIPFLAESDVHPISDEKQTSQTIDSDVEQKSVTHPIPNEINLKASSNKIPSPEISLSSDIPEVKIDTVESEPSIPIIITNSYQSETLTVGPKLIKSRSLPHVNINNQTDEIREESVKQSLNPTRTPTAPERQTLSDSQRETPGGEEKKTKTEEQVAPLPKINKIQKELVRSLSNHHRKAIPPLNLKQSIVHSLNRVKSAREDKESEIAGKRAEYSANIDPGRLTLPFRKKEQELTEKKLNQLDKRSSDPFNTAELTPPHTPTNRLLHESSPRKRNVKILKKDKNE